MIDFPSLQRDYATYLPAISRGYAEGVIGELSRAAPVTASDLNFLQPATELFYLPSALYSAGQADLFSRQPCSVTARDKGTTSIMGDSGGFQIIEGTLKIHGRVIRKPDDEQRRIILDWLERHCDWAMTLDVPPVALDYPSSGYTRFRDCLADTMFHCMYFVKHRRGGVEFLNCLHGRNLAECDLWYDAVRQFPFEGWAFGSGYKKNPYLVLHRLLRMRDEGYLEGKERLHFLGQSGLEIACVLTAIQRALRAHVNPGVRVSFDSSSPFTQAAEYNSVYSGYLLTPRRFAIVQGPMPRSPGYVGGDVPFPWRSPIGDRLTMGDLLVQADGKRPWDTATDHMLMNHNLSIHMEAVIAANRVFELDAGDAKHYCPPRLLELRDIIPQAFRTEDWRTFLLRHRRVLEAGVGPFGEGMDVRGDF
jgi:hypothetical protein